MEYVVIVTPSTPDPTDVVSSFIKGSFSNYPEAAAFAKHVAGRTGRTLMSNVVVYERRTKFNIKLVVEEE